MHEPLDPFASRPLGRMEQEEVQRRGVQHPHAASAAAGRGPRRGRRRLLALAFLVALGTLLALNASLAGEGGGLGLSALPRSLGEAINWLRGPVRIGLQVGHLDAGDQPEELANLRTSTGAHAAGIDEVDVNAAIVTALAARLRDLGFVVDVLPATVPPHYRADVVLSVHADANLDPDRHGYKSAHFTPMRNRREPLLKLEVDRAVLRATALDDDDRNVSGNMLKYYAFNDRHYRHAIARGTPALLVEMGYLSNPTDRRLLLAPERVATVLEAGLLRYLHAVGRLDAVAAR